MQPTSIGTLIKQGTGNLAPARPETRPSATTDEQQFALARQHPKLATLGEDGVKTVLKRIYTMVGLRAQHFPVDQDKALLHRFILKNYGNHTMQEIELAFEMALTGMLELRPDEMRVVDQFTQAYFGRVMTAYRSWALQAHRRLEALEAPQENKPTPQQLAIINLDYACALALDRKLALKPPLTWEQNAGTRPNTANT